MTTFQLQSGMNKGNRRIWIEGDRLSNAGFKRGIQLSREINPDGTMTLSQGDKGTKRHKVAGTNDRPIVDLCGKWVTQFMGDHSHFEVTISGKDLHIRPVNPGRSRDTQTQRVRAENQTPTASDLSSIDSLLASLSTLNDARRPGDSKRAGRFRAGWKDATERNQREYTPSALSKITWTNLGYRLGTELGSRSIEWIYAVYEHIADIWDGEYFAPTSDEYLLEEKADEYEDLIDEANDSYEGEDIPPSRSERPSYSYKRSARVKGSVRRIAKGTCELCEMPAPFKKANGKPYLEVHHVVPLEDGGLDKTTNAVAVCPNCHMRCHHSADAQQASEELYKKVSRLELPKK